MNATTTTGLIAQLVPLALIIVVLYRNRHTIRKEF
jgi:hypothetical protein